MLLLDLTLPGAADNIALDEALLDEAEAGSGPGEVLRFWEPARPLVVLGRSSRPEVEVRLDACAQAGVPVIRRTSGGATIITGPGCLMYALVLSYDLRPELRSIDAAHRLILSQLVTALRTLVPQVERCGTSDLAYGAEPSAERRDESDDKLVLKKFSGNSLRCRRAHLLYHGTLLYDFDLSLAERFLAHPPREPHYRGGRRHTDFITNLPTTSAQLRSSIAAAWQAEERAASWPNQRTGQLVADKYERLDWNAPG
jgi:lipoate---protein ligase